MYLLAALLVMCVYVMVVSSAYDITLTVALGGGMSLLQMLNSVGERTPPCGTPVLNCRCEDVSFLYVVSALRPLM